MLRQTLRAVLSWVGRRLFSLRYRIEVRGLGEIRRRGTHGVLFLPSHLALIDPAILMVLIDRGFHPRALADEYQVTRPVVGWLARLFGARVLPNMERSGLSVMDATRRALAATVEGLRAGECLLFYPAGRLRQQHREESGCVLEGRAGAPQPADRIRRSRTDSRRGSVQEGARAPGKESKKIATRQVSGNENRISRRGREGNGRGRRLLRSPVAGAGRRVLPRAGCDPGSSGTQSLVGAVYSGPYRRVLLQRFPFAVYYEVADNQIRIMAVAHQRRLPGYWKGRE